MKSKFIILYILCYVKFELHCESAVLKLVENEEKENWFYLGWLIGFLIDWLFRDITALKQPIEDQEKEAGVLGIFDQFRQ